MPELVYKCVFCFYTDKDRAKILEHEKECSFNPKNKNCYTCRHKGSVPTPFAGCGDICNVGGKLFYSCDYDEECDLWEQQEA